MFFREPPALPIQDPKFGLISLKNILLRSFLSGKPGGNFLLIAGGPASYGRLGTSILWGWVNELLKDCDALPITQA